MKKGIKDRFPGKIRARGSFHRKVFIINRYGKFIDNDISKIEQNLGFYILKISVFNFSRKN